MKLRLTEAEVLNGDDTASRWPNWIDAWAV